MARLEQASERPSAGFDARWASRSTRDPAIAVMPFADMTPVKNLEYLCDGIAEEIINALKTVPGLRVVGHIFKTRYEDARGVGALLNVGAVLEGSVRADGDRLRVTARLID